MTRAEYEAKYGQPVPAKPAPVQMTRAEYDAKYGSSQPAPTTGAFGSVGGGALGRQSPGIIADAFKGGVNQMKEGLKEAGDGKFPIGPALKMGAGIVNAATAPIAPFFAPLGKGIEAISNKAADIPAVQKFANSPAGQATAKVAEGVNNASVIVGGLAGTRTGPTIKAGIKSAAPAPATTPIGAKPPLKLIERRYSELTKLTENNAPLRRVAEKHQAKGIDSLRLLSQTDLLKGAVDDTGTIRAGNARDELTAFIQPYEKVVTGNLAREGVRVPLKNVEASMRAAIDNSGLEGAALDAAHAKIAAEISGLTRRSEDGMIGLDKVHAAKISKYSTIDYMNPGAKIADKAIARTLKEIVETNTKSVDAQKLNAELTQHFSVLDLLEKLDGKKVEGGRLGKYFASTIGSIVGSHFGPLGAIAGAEVGARLKGASLSINPLGRKGGVPLETSQAMKGAVLQANMPPLMLPAPSRGTPGQPAVQSWTTGGKAIPLGDGFKMEPQAPGYSNSLGRRQINQTTTIAPTKKAIPDSKPRKPDNTK